MTKKTYTSLKSRFMLSVPARFLKNKDGIAAIEFAFVAPVMLFMYFGMAEIAAAISVDRQVSHSANVAGDLTTQSETVSAAQMSEIMAATMMVMNIPADRRDSVQIEIASYARDASDALIEKGKATLNGPYPTTFDANSLDARILSDTSGVVVARVTYSYTPLKLRYTSADINLSETFMLKPRKSAHVDIKNTDDVNPASFTCSFVAGTPTCT